MTFWIAFHTIHCYRDDITLVAQCFKLYSSSYIVTIYFETKLIEEAFQLVNASSTNLDLCKLKNWGSYN